jgi:putative aldouronate transport system permease protein
MNLEAAGRPAIRPARRRKRQLRIKTWPLHVLLLPSVILLLVYSYLPIAGVVIAFQDFKPWLGVLRSPFVGLMNFRAVFTGPEGMQAIVNTVVISLMKIAAGWVVPIVFALLLNEIRITFLKRTIQSLVYLPHFLNWVMLGGILLDMLSTHGIINQTLGLFGVAPIRFLNNGDWFRFILVATDVWKEFGFGAIIYLAAIAGVNPSLYEAADIDGAGQFAKAVFITLPAIIPIGVLLATLSLGNVLNAGFDQVLNLYNPLLYEKGDIIDTYVYRIGLVQGSFGQATAVGLFKSVVGFALISVTYGLAVKYGNYRIF